MVVIIILLLVFLLGYPVLVANLVGGKSDQDTGQGDPERLTRIETALREEMEFLRNRVRRLEALSKARGEGEAAAVAPAVVVQDVHVPEPTVSEPMVPEPMVPEPVVYEPITTAAASEAAAVTAQAEPVVEAAALPAEPEPVLASAAAAPYLQPSSTFGAAPAWLVAARSWLFTGNLVAKFGLLILFIGIGFLLKYAAERDLIPLELRLAGVVLADLALLGFGWRVRDQRRGIALPAQGAALAILMLVMFAAFQRYQLIPAGFAFGLLFALTAFTCLLAVLQNAVWLAAFGICGGFAAPLMVSTGQGSHIALFSYYALLNAGVLAIALKRSWRALNLLGFAFTFVVGTAWGVLKYQGVDYVSAQAFLALFFLFYVAVAIAYAAKQSLLLKHYVDATLVFATPVVAVGLQYALVRDKPYGMALLALALGLFYTGLASRLWRRRGGEWRMLIESFLALGVVFGTLALPFALDQRWTSGAWALEGAGIVWIGVRQKRALTWGFGLPVQAGAWLAFIRALAGIDAAPDTNIWLGFLLLAGAAFAMALAFRKNGGAGESSGFTQGANFLLAFAALWLLGGAWAQLFVSASRFPAALATLFVTSALALAALLVWLARLSDWRAARAFAVVAQLLGGAALLVLILSQGYTAPIEVMPGALMIFASSLLSSRYLERAANDVARALAVVLLWWGAYWWYWTVLASVSLWALPRVYPDGYHQFKFTMRVHVVAVAVSAVLFAHLARRIDWARLRLFGAAAWAALTALTAWMLFWNYHELADAADWWTLLAVWLAAEHLMAYWPRQGWTIAPLALRWLHLVRTAGPWLLLWEAGREVIGNYLRPGGDYDMLLNRAGWHVAPAWSVYLTAWLMMAVLAWLIVRARAARWPASSLAPWYRRYVLPAGVALMLALALYLNATEDGAMAPLPFVPILNPLDLTTASAALLAVLCWRGQAAAGGSVAILLRRAGKAALWLWFNLILLRTASSLLEVPYRFDTMAASTSVQAMLSLTWSLSALVVMRRAARDGERPVQLRRWLTGAALLAVVVAKLFIADLANVGSMARIISFVGVGVLMLLIGYLAPFPAAAPAVRSPSVPA